MAKTDLDTELRKQLLALLKGGQAHATFDEAVKDMPAKLQGSVPEGLPYSPWQLLEHLRITLRDILDFSDNADGSYKELNWPEEYWPKKPVPPGKDAWEKSAAAYRKDLATFEALVKERDLAEKFPWGDGQNLLREALLVADHAAYHIGEIVVARRLLGAWKNN